jgi:hypothetical protein
MLLGGAGADETSQPASTVFSAAAALKEHYAAVGSVYREQMMIL